MSTNPPSHAPQFIGKYQVVRELGRGASATVYLAQDPFHDRHVAVKRIHEHLLEDAQQAALYRRVLRNEALLAGQLRHPCIVAMHDADVEAHPPYIVLEYIDGAPLSRYTRADQLLPVEQVLDIGFKCCSALDYAHTYGLVHRDIKPANLMRQANGNVKLTDFGTAVSQRTQMTQLEGLVGSPTYMAPEQVREEPCTHLSDMFSLAVVVYELLTGRRPFEGESDYATLYKVSNENPPPPSLLRPGLPARLDDVLLRAMAKRPADRYPSWSEFADALLAVNRAMPRREPQHREADAYARMRRLPFFAGFPDAAVWETVRLGTLRSHPAGTALVEAGAPGHSFLVLLDGRACVLLGGAQVATVEAGDTLGEMAYLRRGEHRRTAAAVAETDVFALEIRCEALRQASNDVQLCFDKAFIDLLLKRLITTTDELGRRTTTQLALGI